MSQDFGDEAGQQLLRSIQQATERVVYHYIDKHMREGQSRDGEEGGSAKEWYKEKARRDGKPAEEAEAEAEEAVSREQVCLPFGDQADAAYFAQTCRDNDVYVTALKDAEGNGYVQFAEDDLDAIEQCVPQFSEVMTRLNQERISERLGAEPVTKERLAELTEVDDVYRRSVEREVPTRDIEHDVAETATAEPNHTDDIKQKVIIARSEYSDFAGFERKLAKLGVGITTTEAGENMFYEARTLPDGTLAPFGCDENGKRDWAVGAERLKTYYHIDATHDWFEKNPTQERSVDRAPAHEREPIAADGALDTDAATPALDQGVRSHDGMDTDATTTRIERELNGTDVAPSVVREEAREARAAEDDHEEGYTVKSTAREATASKNQLDVESGAHEREVDISDKLNPVR